MVDILQYCCSNKFKNTQNNCNPFTTSFFSKWICGTSMFLTVVKGLPECFYKKNSMKFYFLPSIVFNSVFFCFSEEEEWKNIWQRELVSLKHSWKTNLFLCWFVFVTCFLFILTFCLFFMLIMIFLISLSSFLLLSLLNLRFF